MLYLRDTCSRSVGKRPELKSELVDPVSRLRTVVVFFSPSRWMLGRQRITPRSHVSQFTVRYSLISLFSVLLKTSLTTNKYSVETVPLEKLIVSQPRNKFSARPGTQRFIILLTRLHRQYFPELDESSTCRPFLSH